MCICVGVCMCVCSANVEVDYLVRVGSVLLLLGFEGLHWGHQHCQQVPLPNELPCSQFLKVVVVGRV